MQTPSQNGLLTTPLSLAASSKMPFRRCANEGCGGTMAADSLHDTCSDKCQRERQNMLALSASRVEEGRTAGNVSQPRAGQTMISVSAMSHNALVNERQTRPDPHPASPFKSQVRPPHAPPSSLSYPPSLPHQSYPSSSFSTSDLPMACRYCSLPFSPAYASGLGRDGVCLACRACIPGMDPIPVQPVISSGVAALGGSWGTLGTAGTQAQQDRPEVGLEHGLVEAPGTANSTRGVVYTNTSAHWGLSSPASTPVPTATQPVRPGAPPSTWTPPPAPSVIPTDGIYAPSYASPSGSASNAFAGPSARGADGQTQSSAAGSSRPTAPTTTVGTTSTFPAHVTPSAAGPALSTPTMSTSASRPTELSENATIVLTPAPAHSDAHTPTRRYPNISDGAAPSILKTTPRSTSKRTHVSSPLTFAPARPFGSAAASSSTPSSTVHVSSMPSRFIPHPASSFPTLPIKTSTPSTSTPTTISASTSTLPIAPPLHTPIPIYIGAAPRADQLMALVGKQRPSLLRQWHPNPPSANLSTSASTGDNNPLHVGVRKGAMPNLDAHTQQRSLALMQKWAAKEAAQTPSDDGWASRTMKMTHWSSGDENAKGKGKSTMEQYTINIPEASKTAPRFQPGSSPAHAQHEDVDLIPPVASLSRSSSTASSMSEIVDDKTEGATDDEGDQLSFSPHTRDAPARRLEPAPTSSAPPAAPSPATPPKTKAPRPPKQKATPLSLSQDSSFVIRRIPSFDGLPVVDRDGTGGAEGEISGTPFPSPARLGGIPQLGGTPAPGNHGSLVVTPSPRKKTGVSLRTVERYAKGLFESSSPSPMKNVAVEASAETSAAIQIPSVEVSRSMSGGPGVRSSASTPPRNPTPAWMRVSPEPATIRTTVSPIAALSNHRTPELDASDDIRLTGQIDLDVQVDVDMEIREEVLLQETKASSGEDANEGLVSEMLLPVPVPSTTDATAVLGGTHLDADVDVMARTDTFNEDILVPDDGSSSPGDQREQPRGEGDTMEVNLEAGGALSLFPIAASTPDPPPAGTGSSTVSSSSTAPPKPPTPKPPIAPQMTPTPLSSASISELHPSGTQQTLSSVISQAPELVLSPNIPYQGPSTSAELVWPASSRPVSDPIDVQQSVTSRGLATGPANVLPLKITPYKVGVLHPPTPHLNQNVVAYPTAFSINRTPASTLAPDQEPYMHVRWTPIRTPMPAGASYMPVPPIPAHVPVRNRDPLPVLGHKVSRKRARPEVELQGVGRLGSSLPRASLGTTNTNLNVDAYMTARIESVDDDHSSGAPALGGEGSGDLMGPGGSVQGADGGRPRKKARLDQPAIDLAAESREEDKNARLGSGTAEQSVIDLTADSQEEDESAGRKENEDEDEQGAKVENDSAPQPLPNALAVPEPPIGTEPDYHLFLFPNMLLAGLAHALATSGSAPNSASASASSNVDNGTRKPLLRFAGSISLMNPKGLLQEYSLTVMAQLIERLVKLPFSHTSVATRPAYDRWERKDVEVTYERMVCRCRQLDLPDRIKSSASNSRQGGAGCGGWIELNVRPDFSHPVEGIIGQRLCVWVWHPEE